MLAVLMLSFLTFWASPKLPAGQPDHAAAPAKAANPPSDPYAPLRLYDGKWDAVTDSAGKPADTVHIENHCAQAGEFFTCNQVINGKSAALVVFLPLRPLENGGYAYRNQALRADGDGPGTWGKVEIVGERWVYSSQDTDNEKKVYWRTINVFSGSDKIHFEVQRSEDGAKWDTTLSGNETRVK